MKKEKITILLIGIFILFTAMSGVIFPESNTVNTANKLSAPSLSYLFGTDQFGRDVFLRTMHGFRYTFLLSVFVVVISFPLGIILGTILGYYGGFWDELFYQFSNVILSFPTIVLAMLIAALTNANIFFLLLLIIVSLVVTNTKIVRGEIKIIKNADYIKNLRVLGASDFTIIKNHLFVKSCKVVMPTFALLIGHVILSISTFSFMGFGIKSPQPEIGTMLNESVRFMSNAPWLMILPGLFQFFAIFLILVLANNVKKLLVNQGGAKYE